MYRVKNVLPLIAAFLLFTGFVFIVFYWKSLINSKNVFTSDVFSTPSPTVGSEPEVKGKKVQRVNIKIKKISKPTPTPTPLSSPKPSAEAGSSVQDYIMKGINDYRASKGLYPVKTDSNTCAFAKIRASEITKTFNHDGFTSRVNSKTLPYTSYSEVTENIAMTSDYKKVVPMWIASSGHAENMRRDTSYVCVVGTGSYFAYEGWRP